MSNVYKTNPLSILFNQEGTVKDQLSLTADLTALCENEADLAAFNTGFLNYDDEILPILQTVIGKTISATQLASYLKKQEENLEQDLSQMFFKAKELVENGASETEKSPLWTKFYDSADSQRDVINAKAQNIQTTEKRLQKLITNIVEEVSNAARTNPEVVQKLTP